MATASLGTNYWYPVIVSNHNDVKYKVVMDNEDGLTLEEVQKMMSANFTIEQGETTSGNFFVLTTDQDQWKKDWHLEFERVTRLG
jgi:hypothetical protein